MRHCFLIHIKRSVGVLIFILTFSLNGFGQQHKIEHNPPIINFEANGLCYNSTTSFVNLTISSSPPTYTWTIYQEGVTLPIYISYATNINIRFPVITSYTVQLEALNAHYAVLSRVFKIDSVLTADFEYTGCQSYFTNYSTCADSYFWDFGDTTYSTEKSPSHSYKYYKVYTAKMIARSGNKSDSATKNFLAFPNYLTGSFTYKVDKDTLYVSAGDTVSAGSYEFHWAWGDATTTFVFSYPGAKQKHVYQKLGRDTTYTVMLLVKSLCYNGYNFNNVTIKDSTIVTGTSVYPNPMSDANLLRVLTERPKEINSLTILNFIGQPVPLYQITQRQSGIDIDFTDLPVGVYFLGFNVGNEQKSFKVIRP